ncbi:MAG: PspC domain-containing protein [Bacillota bacterium]|nr:PspC domain-containing protein [Bacillota bacterium]MDW7682635.1 PspC domain-containing protein [Bacillota bacterium]
MTAKQLRKSKTNRMIAGVCGGIGEYFDVDPTLVRIGWVIFSFLGGSGLLAYIICALIIPSE